MREAAGTAGAGPAGSPARRRQDGVIIWGLGRVACIVSCIMRITIDRKNLYSVRRFESDQRKKIELGTGDLSQSEL